MTHRLVLCYIFAMPDTPTTAAIAGICSIVSGGLPLLVSAWKERDGAGGVGAQYRKVVSGEWVGCGWDTYVQNGTSPAKLNLTFSLKAGPNKITAKSTQVLSSSDDGTPPIVLKMKGGFLSPTAIQLTYTSQDPSRTQYGIILLSLTTTGREMTGHYVGYSPVRQCLIRGEVSLKRAS